MSECIGQHKDRARCLIGPSWQRTRAISEDRVRRHMDTRYPLGHLDKAEGAIAARSGCNLVAIRNRILFMQSQSKYLRLRNQRRFFAMRIARVDAERIRRIITMNALNKLHSSANPP